MKASSAPPVSVRTPEISCRVAERRDENCGGNRDDSAADRHHPRVAAAATVYGEPHPVPCREYHEAQGDRGPENPAAADRTPQPDQAEIRLVPGLAHAQSIAAMKQEKRLAPEMLRVTDPNPEEGENR